jgi:hypothetical protein
MLLIPMLATVMRAQGAGSAIDVPIRALVPTLRYDLQIAREMSDRLDDDKSVEARVLLLGGSESAAYFEVALAGLARVLPRAERLRISGTGHDGPEDDGKPESVAGERVTALLRVAGSYRSGTKLIAF